MHAYSMDVCCCGSMAPVGDDSEEDSNLQQTAPSLGPAARPTMTQPANNSQVEQHAYAGARGALLALHGARDGVPRLSIVLCSSSRGLRPRLLSGAGPKAFLNPRLAV